MESHDLEHISSILYRAIEALAEKREEEGENLIMVKLMKVRSDTGREGNCVLRFDPYSQRYFDDE